jgi:hypothetical protein
MTPVGASYKFKWEGGGEVANEISGLYTSCKAARDAVVAWQLSKFPCKRKKNTIEVALDGTTRD